MHALCVLFLLFLSVAILTPHVSTTYFSFQHAYMFVSYFFPLHMCVLFFFPLCTSMLTATLQLTPPHSLSLLFPTLVDVFCSPFFFFSIFYFKPVHTNLIQCINKMLYSFFIFKSQSYSMYTNLFVL